MTTTATAMTSTATTITRQALTSAPFTARTTFPVPSSLPRSYFLGHHKAGLDKMKTLIPQIDLVIECRDYRIPITGRNPEFEKVLGLGVAGGKKRIVVYTKYDLGQGRNGGFGARRSVQRRDDLLREFHGGDAAVHFSESTEGRMNPRSEDADAVKGRDDASKRAVGTVKALLAQLRTFARDNFSLTGHRVLVAGMPNVGKSTLLNALRKQGVPAKNRSNKKVARTGADPGITRAVGSAVKIIEREDVERPDVKRLDERRGSVGSKNGNGQGMAREASGEGVYLLDTPGVFMPYVPDAISMLKLALCGAVKDTILPPTTVADYLLFSINRHHMQHVYEEFCHPTNEIWELLSGVAKRTGRLGKGAELDIEGAAIWFVKRWRQGRLGKFQLDVVDEAALQVGGEARSEGVSWSQAVKKDRDRKRESRKEKTEKV